MPESRVGQLLADPGLLNARALGLIAAVSAVAQAGAWQVVHDGTHPSHAPAMALAYWGPTLASVLLLRPLQRRTRRASTTMFVLSLACAVGVPPSAWLGIVFGEGAAAVTWAVTAGVESFVVLAGGLLYACQRRRYRDSVAVRVEQIDAVRWERASIQRAVAELEALATTALLEAQAGARLASQLLHDEVSAKDIEGVLERHVRANARSASHAIAATAPPEDPAPPSTRLWRQTLQVPPNLAASFALVGALGLPIVALESGWSGIAVQIVATTVGWLVARVSLTLLRTWSQASASVLAVGLGCLAGVSIALGPWMSPTWTTVAVAVALTPLCLLIALIPSAWRATTDMDDRRIQALDDDFTREQALLIDERASLEQVRHDLVSTLHTTIQGRATAAMVAMGLGAPAEDVDAILAAFGAQDGPEPVDPLAEVLREWQAALAVTAHLDPRLTAEDRARLARHAGEALLNAVRHGRARRATVTAERLTDELLLTVVDDGVGPATGAPSGLGTSLAGREGGTWELAAIEDGGACVRVRLPLRASSVEG